MDRREVFVDSHIDNLQSRILEIGPLNRPCAPRTKYPNSYTVDIRSTEEVKTLYCENDYLNATGITVDRDTIVDIDFVLDNTYEETFKNVEGFDVLIASHVLEHVEDLIGFFLDIPHAMKKDAVLLIIWPEKRYCFDHFRESSSFSDAYDVYRRGFSENARSVFDFFSRVVPENDPVYYWQTRDTSSLLPDADMQKAIEQYEAALQGNRPDDVHYWPFSEQAFLKFMYDATRAHLFPYELIDFESCVKNDQQFMMALQYKPDVIVSPQNALKRICAQMAALPPTYRADEFQAVCEEKEKIMLEFKQSCREIAAWQNTKVELEQNIERLREENAKLIVENVAQEHKQEEIQRENAELVKKNTKFEREINGLKKEKAQFNNTIDQMTQLVLEQKSTIERLSTEVQKVNLQMERVREEMRTQKRFYENSHSWRMTKPLRKVANALRRNK